MADKYILKVTAGPGYDAAHHVTVPVNAAKPVKISSALADVELNVRIRDYGGLPRGSPATSAYFETEPHKANGDQYSICLRFRPKAPSSASSSGADATATEADTKTGISGEDLQFGNDFDHPIRDHLPPGFNTALNIVKWWIDPGLEGDAHADAPYLFGPALSSFNTVYCGEGTLDAEGAGLLFEEGVTTTTTTMTTTRIAVEAVGYVLRNRKTKDVYLVVMFSLYLREDVDEAGSLKIPEAQARKNAAVGRPTSSASSEGEEEEKNGEAARLPDGQKVDVPGDTSIDDVD
ncbi:unnamed protein product [Parascedosporium putredinis]|uniref:Domain of unknown function at the cortex 1 domain-containing protein n=1 Tax=Parascedosporium putredinis TaxID=1442378 RepID=A0A9P1MDC8_9PEZI|nr:unnamed protein product [Parascedosporium putredinis]CAI8003380.1 unnamed protein product [Parascedosporium putredinis]